MGPVAHFALVFRALVGNRRLHHVADVRPSIGDAIALAALAHRGQLYPSIETESYILHPLRVMLAFVEPVDQMTALLHDVVEDTDVTLLDLETAGYPTELVHAIDILTHRRDEPYDGYIERVAGNDITRRVKMRNLTENLANNRRSPSAAGNAERIRRYEMALERLDARP